MKKKLLIALLSMVSAGSLVGAACAEQPKHECGNVCPTCQKCLDADCSDDVCKDKCAGHEDEDEKPEEKVPVTKINVNTDDETHEGTAESPLEVEVTQGNSTQITYGVQPSNATNKKFNWKTGTLTDGAFTENNETGVTVADDGKKITISATAEATDAAICGTADDGSGVSVYLSVKIKSYTAVTSVTSSTLPEAEEGSEYDYELKTALYTNWDIGSGRTKRGDLLAEGKLGPTSEGRNPRNLTYYGSIYNFGITVAPADATDKDVVISYSKDGVVEVDAVSGAITVKGVGETIVTVASYAEESVSMKVKVTVEESLYRGILSSAYDRAATSTVTEWNLDPGDEIKGTEAHYKLYSDWNLVMAHCNNTDSGEGGDNNQKIFYMGNPNKPYGICFDNHVSRNSGASLEDSVAMMWGKLTVPQSALTFNVKLGNNEKLHGQYKVSFVDGEGNVTVLTAGDGWVGFAEPRKESTVKLEIPDDIKGQTGAMIIEHRLTKYGDNAELQIKSLSFAGQVDVESVEFASGSATYRTGAREFKINARVLPDNATNDGITYAMKEDSAEGVTVAADGTVTVEETAAAGDYIIIATSVADPTKTAEFTLTLTEEEFEVNDWNNKQAILEGNADVKWVSKTGFNGDTNNWQQGPGEGVDLSTKHGGTRESSSIILENRKINATSFILTMGIRTFVGQGTSAEIVLKIHDGENVYTIPTISGQKAIPTVDDVVFHSYDLSAYIGKTVTVELGVYEECDHSLITKINFTGDSKLYKEWSGRDDILSEDKDGWTIVGDKDAGVDLGADIKGEGSYLHNEFVIGKDYNAKFTFEARVFVRDGETYPDIKVIVVDKSVEDDEGTLVRAIGVETDTVHVESDDIQAFSYDLSEFIGKNVEIRVRLANAATHCVITSLSLGALETTEN